MTNEEIAERVLRRWGADPLAFCVENFHVSPDPWQLDALREIAKSTCQRLALKACKGPGKTAFLAWVILWFLATRPESKVAATSITEDNLNDNLWAEVSKWMQRSPFLKGAFKWTKTRIVNRKYPENWFATARTWPKSADAQRQADTLAGLHADRIMFVLDESGGIPQAVMTTAEAILASGVEAKIVQAGNPTHLEGPLYRACTQDRELWTVIQITGDPDNPKRSPRIKLDWARQQIKSYGRDNPWVMVNVLGEFPPSSINALLGIEDVERAMARLYRPDQYDWAQIRLGVDVARFGDDRSVIFPRQGLYAGTPVAMRNARTTDIAARVAQIEAKIHSEVTLIDDTGHWGHGVLDQLIVSGRNAIPIVFSGKALNNRYKNRRAEMWMEMSKWVQAGGRLPNIPELVAELIVPTYTFSNGQFLLEDKDQIKERLGRSPDLADALALTFAIPDMPKEMSGPRAQQAHAKTDFDPYANRDAEAARPGRAETEFYPF